MHSAVVSRGGGGGGDGGTSTNGGVGLRRQGCRTVGSGGGQLQREWRRGLGGYCTRIEPKEAMLEGAPLLPRSNPFGFQRALPALQQPLLATKQALLLSKAELSEQGGCIL